MLHQLEIPYRAAALLGEAVRIQMALLEYAASRASLSKVGCATFVNRDPRLRGRGDAAAAWVWEAPTRRLAPLKAFAKAKTPDDKLSWAQCLRAEAEGFLYHVPAALTKLDENKKWQVSAGEFLREFYRTFSKRELPGELLGDTGGQLSRYDFLEEFDEVNHHVHICAACDEARVGGWHRGQLRATIDHFFPESLYPHLSVHPFNLVPICHLCNTAIKLAEDPLSVGGVRCSPRDLVLPYHSDGLAGSTLLGFDLDAWRQVPEPPVAGKPFVLQARKVAGATQRQVDGYTHLLGIPARWNHEAQVHRIGRTAFLRMTQFLRAQPEHLTDDALILAGLDEFLGVLERDNLGMESYTFVIKWLVAHLAEAAHNGDVSLDGLVAALRTRFSEAAPGDEMRLAGARLREMTRA